MAFYPLRRAAVCLLLIALFPATSHGQTSCLATAEIFPATMLADLADFYYGDPGFQFAIMLATNARSAAGFAFIGDPFQLPQAAASSGGTAVERPKVCVPELTEATRLRNWYQTYLDALEEMEIATPEAVSNSLVPITPGGPVTVATWIRSGQLARYKTAAGDWVAAAPGDTWVTVAPHLQNFCKAFVQQNGNDAARLSLRLEQRLGLPPLNGKTTFLTFTIAAPDAGTTIFRPCASPEIDTTSCPVRGSADDACSSATPPAGCERQQAFFNQQYYQSYGAAEPTGYPWTSLGYTFDWARQKAGPSGKAPFVRFGESEYVVSKGAPITIVGAETTAEFCGLN